MPHARPSSSPARRVLHPAVRTGLWVLVAAGAIACTDSTSPPTGASQGASRATQGASHGASSVPPLLHAWAVDDSQRVTLTGNTHPDASPVYSTGPLPGDFQLQHMQLVLQRAPEREAALETFIDALHDKTSPSYQHWLTVSQFADAYGVAPEDIAVVVAWLTKEGFHVDSVAPSRMFVEFSGTAAQVNAAFHAEIHGLLVDGHRHFGNMRDPEIPAELAKVVVGIHALHDFMPHPMHEDRGAVRRDGATGRWTSAGPVPDFDIGPYGTECATNKDCGGGTCDTVTGLCSCTANNQCKATLSGAAAACNTAAGTCVQCQSNADCIGPSTCNTTTKTCKATFLAVTPADFATVYDLNPLFTKGIVGAGQTLVVIEDTLLQNTSDVATFRTAFGLSAYKGTFSQGTVAGTTTCANPGVNAAEGEAALDADWATATAPGANIQLAACADTTVFGGLIALENLINGAAPPHVVSISYGECEADLGTAAKAQYVTTYEQAATQGVSVFVSAGDEGAASCDANKTVATHGIAVSGFASTPYNVAVGGTDFGDYVDNQRGGPAVSTYWSATNGATFGSALSYIPEIPWNDSCASEVIYSTPAVALGTYTQAYGASGFCNSTVGKLFQTTGAGSGGPSTYSAQPSWQTGVVGLPAKSGGARTLPDVSLFAANGVFGHFLIYCMTDAAQGGGPCTYTNDYDALTLAAGGTSFAAPAMAGIQALIDQYMAAAQGNPNYTYYKLAAAEQGARGSARCNSSRGTAAAPVLPDPDCVFHDVTVGDIDVNCTGTNCFGNVGSGTQGALSPSATTFSPAYAAGTGWDYATGLGTVDAYNLVMAWSN